jgi:hypothetical protein
MQRLDVDKQTQEDQRAPTTASAQTALTVEPETAQQATSLFVLVVKPLRGREMPQLDVDKQIPADQPVQTTVVELTGLTVQPQIENPIQPIELVGPNINLDTFWKTLMDSCNNTTDRRQKTENT